MIGRGAARRGLSALALVIARISDRRPIGENAPLAASRRILFLQYETAVGSAANATPLLEALRRASPNVFIAVAAAGVPYEILKHNPNIDQLVATADPHRHPIRAAWTIISSIGASEPFDCVVTDTGNMKTRIALLALLSRARWRVGYSVRPALYHAALSQEGNASVLQNNLRLLTFFGHQPGATEPRVYFAEPEYAAAQALLERHDVADSRPRVVFVTQTSGGQPSRWYDDRFAAVADALVTRFGAAVMFVGTAKEKAGIDRIRQQMRAASVDLAGQTDIPTLCALLSLSDLVVTVDTGTMHLARAAGTPAVIVAAAWQPAHEWLPLGVPFCRIVRRNDIGCRHCRKFFCATHECMDEIGVTEVTAAAEAMIAEYPPSPQARRERVDRSLSSRPSRSER